ncbi:MAG: acyl-CoA dehydrogenase family protein [Deltaproteobacteria bacterium]|nr:acyl-CoA dehydrogenase family protein [Deltaproteobacteria bacterium]MBW2086729.1 acyl-CoA dehydrogenase family protein [Deltaproteobacteria bacterium]
MDFEMSMEQEILRKTVRDFAVKKIRPVARELDEKEAFSLDTCQAMGDLGLFGMIVDEAYGGQEMDYISYAIAVEQMARIDGSHAATIAAGNSLGIGPIYYFGNEEQKKKYLPDLCHGHALWGFGLTEAGAGSDAGNAQTTAVLDGDMWVVNGSKIFITNASTPISLGVTVLARTGAREDGRPELSCILIEHGTPGFEARTMHGKMIWRAANTSELYFEDCRVPKKNLLGTQGHGFHQMLETLDAGRLSIAAMGVGGAQGAFDLAKRYAQERVQFGRPISTFQVNAFKLADMALEIEAARLLLYKACWLRDNHKSFSKLAAMAKLYASEVMGRVVNEAVQLHGGYGLMKEYDIERFYRDQKLLTIGEGTSEIQRLVIARLIGVI